MKFLIRKNSKTEIEYLYDIYASFDKERERLIIRKEFVLSRDKAIVLDYHNLGKIHGLLELANVSFCLEVYSE